MNLSRTGQRVEWIIAALAAFAGTFVFRFLTVDFTNDQFTHLTRARQIILGDLPIRDFFDPGQFLHYYASAAAQAIFGFNLFAEAVVTMGFMALAATLTLVVSRDLSGSRPIAACATVVAVAAFPRLYNYPKALLYVLAIWGFLRYTRRPYLSALSGLALITATAFLFRHDHGIYIWFTTTVFLTIIHWRDRRQLLRAPVVYGALTCALLLPFAVYVQRAGGLTDYLRSARQSGRMIGRSLGRTRPAFSIDRSRPFVTVDPPAGPRINVRWLESTDEASRRVREAQYGLTQPMPEGDHTWSYVVTDHRRENIRGLVKDGLVADTHGIDRGGARLSSREPLWQRFSRAVPVNRLSVHPGVFTGENAHAWFYYGTVILPFLALAVLARRWWTLGIRDPAEVASIGAIAVLNLIINQTLLRDASPSRLADVATPTMVLGAWLAGQWRVNRSGAGAPAGRTTLKLGAALGFFVITLWSVSTVGGSGRQVLEARLLSGPGAAWTRLQDVNRWLHLRPIDAWAPEPSRGIRALARYVLECTQPTDRLFVTWFEPGIAFYAERAFAGGQVHLFPGWHASAFDQQLTVSRLRRQQVPIVLAAVENDHVFRRRFSIVHEYVYQHYAVAADSAFGDSKIIRVLVERQRTPVRTYRPLNLPCYSTGER